MSPKELNYIEDALGHEKFLKPSVRKRHRICRILN